MSKSRVGHNDDLMDWSICHKERLKELGLFTLQMMRLGRDVPSAYKYLIGGTKKTEEDFSGSCPVRGQRVMGSD